MQIITVTFNPNATAKSYDYLLINPTKSPINAKLPLKVCSGSDAKKILYRNLYIVGQRQVETLPSWVTSQITVGATNVCTMGRLSAAQQEHLRPTAVKVNTAKSATIPYKINTRGVEVIHVRPFSDFINWSRITPSKPKQY